ncbi:MAG: hypothetical protein IKN14_08680 [Clostridiales bacterium]|nr:hypothetical protein [Clostridiales bacterium]
MGRRLIDKLIIAAASVIPALFRNGRTPGWTDVVFVLLLILIVFFTELQTSMTVNLLLTTVIVSASFVMPSLVFAVPCLLCGVVTSEKTEKENGIVLILLTAVTSAAILFAVILNPDDIYYSAVVLVLGVIAVYLSYKTVESRKTETLIREKYDSARLGMINAKRLGEELMKNADNEINMARLRERNRIAREIHDNVGHMITRVLVQLQAVKIINRDEKVAKQLDSMGETLDLAMTGMRKSVHELHEDSVDLSIEINEAASVLKDRFDVTVRTFIESPADITLKNAIIGVVKEAVTNIFKYSNGDSVLIETVENVTFWRVKIYDNGSNPEREYDLSGNSAAEGEGIGLQNIGSRTRSLGGRATAVSDGNGFTIVATFPKNGRSEQ